MNQINNCVDPLAEAAKGDAAQLGRQVCLAVLIISIAYYVNAYLFTGGANGKLL